MSAEIKQLECGCEMHNICGKVVWIFCDEHEEDVEQPVRTQQKGFKMLFYNE